MNKKTVFTFLFAAALSVVLAGCAGGAATSAGASADAAASADTSAAASATAETTGTVSLQIVNVDEAGAADVMLNKSYGFEEGAVIVDLFDAAVAAGDLKEYETNEYGFIQSFTFADGTKIANADDFSTYWAQYENAVYYAGQENLLTEALTAGTAYQFGMETYEEGKESTPTDWSALEAPTEGGAIAVPSMAAAA